MTWLLETLPENLRAALVHGSCGAGHLSRCAGLAAGAGFERLGVELALAAWAESPLDAGLARAVASSPMAAPAARELARHVAENTRPPADLSYYLRLAERRDAARIASYLDAQSAREPGNLFWARLGLVHALDAGDRERVTAASASLPEPLSRLVEGDAAAVRGDWAVAVANYARCARLWECPGLEARLGLACLGAGDAEAARGWLFAAVRREPWRVQALLALHDLAWGRRELRAMPEGRVAVLLYTFSKAGDIHRTLESLFASRLGQARVTVLDNGSPDETPQVLASWQGRAGPDRLEVVRLPVNVGAPAARNWLLSLESSRSSDWTVFLDDDVALPPDWLELLGAAAGLYPGAGAVGARVRDFSRPSHIQSADVFLVPGEAGEGAPFTLTACHHETLDRGQFSYVRPCATVTGCCHMLRTATLLESGGFDLRYSPSQYDDLDHDVRLLLKGLPQVCQGHLAVGHFKSTGAQGSRGQAQFGLGFANQHKLHAKFSPAEVRLAARAADEAAWRDALAKWRALPGA